MELWIRSQDKTTLIKSYEIYISEQQNTYLIRAKRTSHILGSYSTIERAIQILDEIQNKLNIRHCNDAGIQFILINEMTPIIYEMPKD